MATKKSDSTTSDRGGRLPLADGAAGDGSSDAAAPTTEAVASFEHSVRRLGEIVEKLEGGDLPLEDSLQLFEEGVKLARRSQAKLDAAEKRVEELLGIDEEGEPVVRDLDVE